MKIKTPRLFSRSMGRLSLLVALLFLVGGIMDIDSALAINITWKRVATTEDNITVYEGEVEGYSLVAFKGVAVIDEPLDRVASVIYDEDQKKAWMDRVEGQYRIQKLHPGKTIVYNQTYLPWPVNNREFVYEMDMVYDHKNKRLDATLKNKDGFEKVKQDGTVRGVFLDSGFNLIPHDNGKKTKIEVRVMVDPKGWLPAWLVNLIQASWPENTIRGLRRQSRLLNKIDQDIASLMKK